MTGTESGNAVTPANARSELLLEVFRRLMARYGPQHWWPGDGPLETIVGAILTQGTSWAGVDRAIFNLKARGLLTAQALKDVPEGQLAAELRPSRFFNAKARKLKAFIDYLWGHYQGDLGSLLERDPRSLRGELLSIHGIGEETADDILLYAAGRPFFVVDSYTRRITSRLGLSPSGERYSDYQEMFHDALPMEAPLFNEYHALLDMHAKEACRVEPRCDGCCLLELCPTGRRLTRQLGCTYN